MSTILLATLLISFTAGIPILLITLINRKKRREKSSLMAHFHEEGSKRGLSFSSTEHLRGTIFGFDGLRQSLLVYEYENDKQFHHIDLSTVSKCLVIKEVETIQNGEASKPSREQHLRSIELCFEFAGRSAPYSICYYHSNHNSIYELSSMQQKADCWEVILGKIVRRKDICRA